MVKQITFKRLENIALFYLQRYDSCSTKLNSVLKRRVLRAKKQGIIVPDDSSLWIEQVVLKMIDLGYIDDKRYAENIFRRLQNNGKSSRYIAAKLKQDGLDTQLIQTLIDSMDISCDEMDIVAAEKLVRKKKLGYFRTPELRREMYQKDLAVLGRAGFSYEIAKQALKIDED